MLRVKNLLPKFVYLVFLSLIFLFGIYHLYFGNKIIPGVYVGSVNLGGMNQADARLALKSKLAQDEHVMRLYFEGHEFFVSKQSIDLEYDLDATLREAFRTGRTGDFLSDSRDKFLGVFRPIDISAYYFYDDVLLNNLISQMHGEIDIEPQNALFVLGGEKTVTIREEVEGRVVDKESIYNDILFSLGELSFFDREIPVVVNTPSVKAGDLLGLEEDVQRIVYSPPVVKYLSKSWRLPPEQVIELITVGYNPQEKKPDLKLNKIKFDNFLETLALEVNTPPKGLVAFSEEGKVAQFELTLPGTELDRQKFAQNFSQALFDGDEVVEVPVFQVEVGENASKYGIKELLAEGVSKFTGSASGRVHNLSLAAERVNGTLVPPGGVFSFNNAVGEISGKTGYDSAYIIANGRTVLGSGGGVCQTSTTLYRAVLNAGLPIVTRHGHAYRVGYYELDQPVGFDAAIYQPSLDFKFKNDTDNYILVEAESDKTNSTLFFRLYGTKDNREVTITNPVVTNQVPPPEPLYQDDPDLPKGTTKQIDFAAWGATSSYSRTVTKNGEVLYEDTFTTRYQPWRAIYLVGTKN